MRLQTVVCGGRSRLLLGLRITEWHKSITVDLIRNKHTELSLGIVEFTWTAAVLKFPCSALSQEV